MADLVQAYLNEVEKGLRRGLDRAEAEAVLLETELHLRERMSALEELGIPSEAAAREAIAAFGAALPYAREMTAVQNESPRSFNRSIYAAASVLGTLVVLFMPTAPLLVRHLPSTPLFVWAFLTAAILIVGIGAASYRARRILPLPLLGISVATGIGMWCALSALYYNLYLDGGVGYLPRWEVASAMASWSGEGRDFPGSAQSREALQIALRRGYAYQLIANPTYFATTTAMMALVTLSANLVGTWLGRAMRGRRIWRIARG